jgi:hypothetical protein
MEETRDIRELKALLAGYSSSGKTMDSLTNGEKKNGDSSAQKIVLLKSLSFFLLSLSLFLALLLVVVVVHGYFYFSRNSHNHAQQVMTMPRQDKAEPARTENAPSVIEQRKTGAAPVYPSALLEAALPEKENLPQPAAPFDKEEVPRPVEPSSPALESPAPASPALYKPAAAAKEAITTIMLKEGGGSLYFIALKRYGKADETIYDLILQANPDIVDVRNIDDRQKIILPLLTAESYITGCDQDGYRIHVGTYESAQWADIYGAQVKSAGKRVFVEPRRFSAQDIWYRLMIGDFSRKEEALQTVSSMVERGLIFLPLPPG